MATNAGSTTQKGKTPAQPQKVVCTYCGKTITKGTAIKAGHGSRCAKIAAQFTPQQLQAHYKKLSVAVMPKGYITVGTLDKVVKAQKHNYAGLTITRMVNSFGKDRASSPPINPIAQVYYLPNRHRVVHGWLQTPAGLTAMATGNFSKAPAPPKVQTI